jgi:hypothetical protein
MGEVRIVSGVTAIYSVCQGDGSSPLPETLERGSVMLRNSLNARLMADDLRRYLNRLPRVAAKKQVSQVKLISRLACELHIIYEMLNKKKLARMAFDMSDMTSYIKHTDQGVRVKRRKAAEIDTAVLQGKAWQFLLHKTQPFYNPKTKVKPWMSQALRDASEILSMTTAALATGRFADHRAERYVDADGDYADGKRTVTDGVKRNAIRYAVTPVS